MHHYKSILRVREENVSEFFWDCLKAHPKSFDELFFFNHFTHSVLTIEEHRQKALALAPLLRRAEKEGYWASINVLCTLAHAVKPEHASFLPGDDRIQWAFGKMLHPRYGSLCPTHPENIAYIKELYRIYARLAPHAIYIDDDLSQTNCACPRCMRLLEQKYHIFGDLEPTGENLYKLISGEESAERNRARAAYLAFNTERIGDVCAAAKEAVAEIDTTITVGLMTCRPAAVDEWTARLVRGDGTKTRVRPGGGVWNEFDTVALIDKSARMAAQIRYLGDEVESIDSEIENFPCHTLRKSPSYTAFESFVYLGTGCTASAYNVLTMDDPVGEEHEIFFKTAEDARAMSERIVDALGAAPLEGVGPWWDKMSAVFPADEDWKYEWSYPMPVGMYHVGLPMACRHENISVFFLSANNAKELSDEALEKLLSGSVYMDAPALDVINARGFGAYTGFRVTGRYESDTMEGLVAHPLNPVSESTRNARQALWLSEEAYAIEKTDEHAEYLSEHMDLYGNRRGGGAGVFENSLGGRICVSGITPFSWYYSLVKNTQIKRILRWLSKDTIPAYVKSYHLAPIWSRNGCALVANFALEDAKDVTVAMKTDATEARVTVSRGASIVEELTLTAEKDGAYKLFKIPSLPITGCALIEPKK